MQGFETRGTVISRRLTAWTNLLDATKPSGQFAVDPRDIYNPVPTAAYNKSNSIKKINKLNKGNQKSKRKKVKKKNEIPKVCNWLLSM